jgi:hypothetical protein
MNRKQLSTLIAAIVATLPLNTHAAATPSLAPWLSQIGETSAILSAANWGTGMLLGVVDTGIVASNPIFASGQVSASLSSCAAVTFRCSNGVTDDNGHGTAVASIAAGNKTTAGTYSYAGYTVAANSYIGVAPNANIVAEKVLNSAGSGYSSDIANGINKAVAAGASVINLSLTYIPSSDIIAAINNAAAKGVFIVFAGGNSATALNGGANSSGFTASAIQHLIFAGATDTSASKLASFSNTPGTGKLTPTTGTATSYASRWIDAPGVNILAPGITYGPNAMAIWSGTSMAAPLVSGSLILLESAWPILKTNGTAANLLLSTATDLGAKGVDNTYGTGLVNLSTAFQPYGALSVTTASKAVVPVSSMTGSIITGGALGNLTSVKSLLSNYMAFDTYQRNFTVNLSGLIQTKPIAASLNTLPVTTNTGVKAIKLIDGSEIMTWRQPTNDMDALGQLSDNAVASVPVASYLTFKGADGSALGFGYGVPGQFSFARALYGDDKFSSQSGALDLTTLAGIATGGYHLAYGADAGDKTRWAVSFSQTGSAQITQPGTDNAASSLTLGLSHKLSGRWTGGLTVGMLKENAGLLGSSYDAGSALSLGANHSTSLGLSLGYAVSNRSGFLLEAGAAYTNGTPQSGLFASTSNIQSRSFGVSFLSSDLAARGDKLSVSLKQPMRVTSGTVNLVMPGVAADGTPTYTTQAASLAPNGRELDAQLSYDTPLGKGQSLGFNLGVMKDAQNIAGNRNEFVGSTWTMKF